MSGAVLSSSTSRLGFVQVDLDAALTHTFDGLVQLFGARAQEGAFFLLLLLQGENLGGHVASRRQGLAHDAHIACDVDSHRTDRGATTTLGTVVKAELFPLGEIFGW